MTQNKTKKWSKKELKDFEKIILEKRDISLCDNEKICDSLSITSKRMANDNGFEDIDAFFSWHKEIYGDEYWDG